MTDVAEQVDLPGRVEAEVGLRDGDAALGEAGDLLVGAAVGGVRRYARQLIELAVLEQGARLVDPRHRLADVEVGGDRARRQGVEFRILEGDPPGGLGRRRRHGRDLGRGQADRGVERGVVDRAHRAGRGQQQGRKADGGEQAAHDSDSSRAWTGAGAVGSRLGGRAPPCGLRAGLPPVSRRIVQ